MSESDWSEARCCGVIGGRDATRRAFSDAVGNMVAEIQEKLAQNPKLPNTVEFECHAQD